jgi:hypothetical protein
MSTLRFWHDHPLIDRRPARDQHAAPNGDVDEQLDRVLQEVHSVPLGYQAARLTVDANRVRSDETADA